MDQLSALHTLTTKLSHITNVTKPLFVLITGASGVGKTTITTLLEHTLDSQFTHVAYFDRIGVPSEQEMIARYGSGKEWQTAKTYEWVANLNNASKHKPLIIFEGQYDPEVARAACHALNIKNILLIGIYAERSVREARLIYERNQPELANQDMQNWSELLKKKVTDLGGNILDTTEITPTDAIEKIVKLILKKLE